MYGHNLLVTAMSRALRRNWVVSKKEHQALQSNPDLI